MVRLSTSYNGYARLACEQTIIDITLYATPITADAEGDRYTIVQNDTPRLMFELHDAQGKLIDLSTLTRITFRMQRVGDEQAILSRRCNILNSPGTDGKCYIDLRAADTATDGEFNGELEVHYGVVGVASTLKFGISIVNELANAELTPPEWVDIPPSPNMTGIYDIKWDVVTDAENYILEESTDGITWVVLYSGPLFIYNVTGKTDGVYYYRVKSICTDMDDSEWADEIQVTVDI